MNMRRVKSDVFNQMSAMATSECVCVRWTWTVHVKERTQDCISLSSSKDDTLCYLGKSLSANAKVCKIHK